MKTIGIMVVVAVVGLSGVLPIKKADAATQSDLDRIKEEIAKIQKEINGYETEAKRLAGQANTLQNKIAALRAEEAQLAASIALNQAEHDRLVIEIETIEKRIADNSDMIGHIVAQYYYNDEVSVLERLASSESFAGFIDNEARMSNMADNLSGIVVENKALKAEAEVKRDEVKLVLQDLAAKKEALVQKRAEQQRLLDETRGMESEYARLTQVSKEEKERLEAEEARVQAELCKIYGCSGVSAGDPNKGGYPYSAECPAAKWYGRQRADQWGMYTCECVSYTAWKVYQNYRNMPYWGGKGNAYNWDENARAAGIPIGKTPKVGSVGMYNAGWKNGYYSNYGHVVWVEAVAGDRIKISQYNEANAATNYKSGEYSEKWVNKDLYDWFIYFGEW